MDEIYDDFSTVYDECKIDEFSIKFGKSMLKYFNDVHPNEILEKHLDLCCGTGALCNLFKENGIETKGVDISIGMLNVATNKYPDIEFIHSNILEYHDNETYDFITCVHDSINHINLESDLRKVFKNVNGFLRKDGFFIFDMLFKNKIGPGDFEKFVNEGSRLIYHTEINDEILKIETEYYENGQFLWKDESVERMYSIEKIIQILNEEGFILELCSQSFYEETRDDMIKIISRKID